MDEEEIDRRFEPHLEQCGVAVLRLGRKGSLRQVHKGASDDGN